MTNFEEKFNKWRERMNQKSEKEKHNYALSVAFFFTALITFFVVSNWYFIISGNSFNSSLFTDIEQMYAEQKEKFGTDLQSISQQKDEILDLVKNSPGISE